jgi:hypothetical protein
MDWGEKFSKQRARGREAKAIHGLSGIRKISFVQLPLALLPLAYYLFPIFANAQTHDAGTGAEVTGRI